MEFFLDQDMEMGKVKDAKMFDKIDYIDVIDKGLKVMDATAISLCMENKMPIVVFNLLQNGNIKRAVLGQKIGTVVKV